MGKKKLGFLFAGTEVVTEDLRIAVVDMHWSDDNVVVRYHYANWPFPEIDVKSRKQLTQVQQQYEEALF